MKGMKGKDIRSWKDRKGWKYEAAGELFWHAAYFGCMCAYVSAGLTVVASVFGIVHACLGHSDTAFFLVKVILGSALVSALATVSVVAAVKTGEFFWTKAWNAYEEERGRKEGNEVKEVKEGSEA